MVLFKPIIKSQGQEKEYRNFMLRYETYSLYLACLIGAAYLLTFLVVDYWRAGNYKYVLIFRLSMIAILVASALTINRIKFTPRNFEFICLFISGSIILLSLSLDFTAGMPPFFLPNFLCLLLYVFNAGLGYPLTLKSIYSGLMLTIFLIYAHYISPHQSFHFSQVWNLLSNLVISLLIGYLIERYKQINFIQREKLQKARKDLKAIFDAALVSIIETDINGTITHFNKGAERLLGYTADEVIEKHTPALIHLNDEVKSRGNELTQQYNREIRGFDVFVEFARQGKPEAREWTYVRKDGTTFPVQVSVTAIRNVSNSILGFLGIATDITELKAKNLTIQTQKTELETLNATKDKFFSLVAHDLKSPLNSLKAFSGLLIEHFDQLSKGEILTMSRELKNSVEQTIKMADNLITWAKIQMKEFQYQQQVIYINEIVTNISDVYNPVAKEKGITLNCSVDGSLTLLGDKNQIEFIIRNLINNAIKFTDRDGFVNLTAKPLSDSEIEISVSDNGTGISDEMKEKIFSTGNKRSTDGTAGEKGTGLGLMLCYEFVKLNAGQINVESKLGKGTTFRTKFKSV